MKLTLAHYIAGVTDGTLDPQTVLSHYLTKADPYNAIITRTEDYAHAQKSTGTLLGAPIGIKDNILVKGIRTTSGSKMMENFVAPYTATCYDLLEKAGGIMIAKTNMDEYAMGSTNESSFFGTVDNPAAPGYIPWGSSGGSAAAVSGDLVIAALGSDTWGSVRQPAAHTGIVGVKPSYGRVSRYGVQAMASSLDQVGTFTKTVTDAQLLLGAISGHDPLDSMSVDRPLDFIHTQPQLQGKKLALPKQFMWPGLDAEVKKVFEDTLKKITAAGATVELVDMEILDHSVAVYYALMPAEVSTNLARFDGIRFGLQKDTFGYESLRDYYVAVRSEGFGDEATRRILLGSYVLSSANYAGFYQKAQKARNKMIHDVKKIRENYDAIISPTSPEVARKPGEKSDPLSVYLADIYTIPANLIGSPALSLPMGLAHGRPTGLQIMTKARDEAGMFALARGIEGII